MDKPIKILIADDHKMVRNGVRLMLESQKVFKTIITEASNGFEVLHFLEKEQFDVVLLDISMPEMDGIVTLKKIKSKSIKVPVIMMTMHNEENVINKAVELGACGYILKNSGIDELVKAIQSVINRERYFSNEVSQILIKGINKKVKTTKNEVLSDRELEVLVLIVRELTNKEIAEKLNLSYRTVEGHRIHIMEKLNLKSTIGLVKYALKKNIDLNLI